MIDIFLSNLVFCRGITVQCNCGNSVVQLDKYTIKGVFPNNIYMYIFDNIRIVSLWTRETLSQCN